MKPLEHVRKVVDRVERTPLRPLVAASASVVQSLRRRKLHTFFIDREGDWVNRQRDATFVSPVRHTRDAREVEEIVHDNFGLRYVPRPGDVVVDVGAGIGEETVTWSRLVGLSGRVIAIEAQPRTYRCLAKTVERNGLENVTTVHCAVTDRPQDVFITDDIAQHLGNAIVGQRAGAVRVPGRTLDSVLAELAVDRVDFLKMNIEGAEKPALDGMTDTIARTRAAAIACHDFIADAGGSEETRTRAAVQAFLERHDFDVVRRTEDPRPWVRDHLYAVSRGTRG